MFFYALPDNATRKTVFLFVAEFFAMDEDLQFIAEREAGISVEGMCDAVCFSFKNRHKTAIMDEKWTAVLDAVFWPDAIRIRYAAYWGNHWGRNWEDQKTKNYLIQTDMQEADECRALGCCFLATMPQDILDSIMKQAANEENEAEQDDL